MSPTHRELREALEEERDQSGLWQLLLAYGEDFEPRTRPDNVTVGEKRYCFRNAFRLARERRDLEYVEGRALEPGHGHFHQRHGWCVDAAGRVFDPTPTWADPPPGNTFGGALLGVRLPLDLVEEHVEQDGEATRGALDALRERGRLDEVEAWLKARRT